MLGVALVFDRVRLVMKKNNKYTILFISLMLCVCFSCFLNGCSSNNSSRDNSNKSSQQQDNNKADNKEEVKPKEENKDTNIDAQETVIKQYFKYVNDCNIEGMLAVCDANSNNIFNASYSLLQFLLNSSGKNDVNVRKFFMLLFPSMKSYLKGNDVNFSITSTSIEVSPIDKTHSTATVMVDINVTAQGQSSKTTSREELDLVKEGNSWKIDIEEACREAVSAGIDLGLGVWGF